MAQEHLFSESQHALGSQPRTAVLCLVEGNHFGFWRGMPRTARPAVSPVPRSRARGTPGSAGGSQRRTEAGKQQGGVSRSSLR